MTPGIESNGAAQQDPASSNGQREVPTTDDAREVGAVVVGAGFGGLYATYRLRSAGFEVVGFERGDDVGGTWFWNRYPGARCDVESLEYSYSFSDELQQGWRWNERYATQPEILAYARHVADQFDLRPHFQFGTGVVSATFDSESDLWSIRTDDDRQVLCRYLILATGGVSRPYTPNFDGLDRFAGEVIHTGAWPANGVVVDGKRVAIIGTGGSGVQVLPVLADRAAHVSVLQRTPTYVVPAHNRPTDAGVEDVVKADYRGFRQRNAELPFGFGAFFDQSDVSALAVTPEERDRRYQQRWDDGGYSFLYTFGDLATNPAAAETAAGFIKGKIHQIVHDPEVASALCPTHPFGCRRIVIGTDYYESFNRPNVSLVDAATDPIIELTPTGIRTEQAHIDADVIVFATGFEDQAASFRHINLVGPGSESLATAWSERPKTYLGLCTAGFPNAFFVNAPGSPSITTNMIANIEHTVDWLVDCVVANRRAGFTRIEVDEAAQQSWTARVDAGANGRLLHSCTSRYVGTTADDGLFVFPYLGVPDYRATLAAVADEGYPGLLFSSCSTEQESEPASRSAALNGARAPAVGPDSIRSVNRST